MDGTMNGVAFPRHTPRVLADDGSALQFCSTCAFSQACLDEGMDKSSLGELHVLVEHVGPFRAGDHIFREGDPFEAIAAVRAGTVKTYVVDRDGHEQVLRPHDDDYQNNAAAVGGGTRVFGAQAWRFLPLDFAMASTYGVPVGSSLADWPISYQELAPFYERAEWEIGVAGDSAASARIWPREKGFPMPPVPLNRDQQKQLSEDIKRLTNGQGADVLYDPVGDYYAEPALRAMNWNGRYLVIGFAAGNIPKVPLNLTLLKGCQICGVFWGSFAMREPVKNRANADRVLAWVASGSLRPRVDKTFSFADAAQGIAHLEARAAKGKVVLVP